MAPDPAGAAVADEATQLRLIAEFASDVIGTFTPEGRILYVSPASRSVFGYDPEEMIGRSAYEIVPAGEDVTVIETARASVEGGASSQTVSHRIRRKDGLYAWVETTLRGLRDPASGAVDRIVCVTRDVTARKEAEEALRESEERYRLLFDQNPQPIWVFDRETFRFLAVNQAALDMYGYSREEFLAMEVTEVRPPDQVAHFVDRAGRVRDDLVRQGEFVHRKRDGTVFDVDVFARRIEFAGRRSILALLNDVTERKQAEARLRASEEMSRSLLENAPDIIVTLSPDGCIRSFNREMAYLDRDALVGQSILQFCPPEIAGRIRAMFDRVLRTGQREIIEVPGAVAGMTFWYRGYVGPLRENGRIGGLIATAMNITEEKRVQEELIKAHRELERRSGELAGVVENLHREIERRERVERDLRRSRSRLRGLSTRLLSAQEEERRRISREVHDELGQALTAMKMELAAIRRDQAAGREDPTARIEMVDGLIEEAIHTVRRIARDLRPGALDDLGLEAAIEGLLEEFRRRSGVEFSLKIEPEDLGLDPVLSTTVFRVVQEALTNVARHAGATQVSVSLRVARDRLTLQVDDDGRGITRAEVSGASSLGLVGIRERARLCGGTVRFTGAPGHGTRLRLCLPLRTDAAPAPAPVRRRRSAD